MLTFVLEAESLASGDAGRDLDRQLALAADAAGATTRRTRLGDGFSGSSTVGAGPRDGEEALLVAQLTRTPALVARLGRSAGRGPGPSTRLARFLAGDLNRGFGADGGFLEADFEVVAEIGAALRTAAASPSAEDVAESERVAESGKDVGEIGKDRRIESRAAAIHAGVPEPVVEASLVAIGKDRVGLGGFLEPFLGLAIVRVAIGVVLQRELAIRAFDLLVGCFALDAQHFVIVPLAHAIHPSPP